MNITHTYYDCSDADSEEDYWFATEAGWHAAALMVPISLSEERSTMVYFYPIYSPAEFSIDVEIYNGAGKLLGTKNEIVHITSPLKNYEKIDFKALCRTLSLPLDQDYAARIIARPPVGKAIPARIKIGLDLSHDSRHLPCNICTNLQPFNPAMDAKPQTFRWSPVLTNELQPTLWILNSSPAVDYRREAEVVVTFFREKDAATHTLKLTLAANGFQVIYPNADPVLKEFFGNEIGWMTAVANNPYMTTFYFVEHTSGVVGGDHGF
jgi:hypothetical protein